MHGHHLEIPIGGEEGTPLSKGDRRDLAVHQGAHGVSCSAAGPVDERRVLEIHHPLDLEDLEAGEQSLNVRRGPFVRTAGQQLHEDRGGRGYRRS